MAEVKVAEITVSELAFLRREDYQVVYRALHRGQLEGRRERNGRWVVILPAVELERLRKQRQTDSPRARAS